MAYFAARCHRFVFSTMSCSYKLRHSPDLLRLLTFLALIPGYPQLLYTPPRAPTPYEDSLSFAGGWKSAQPASQASLAPVPPSGGKDSKKEQALAQFIHYIETRDPIAADKFLKVLNAHQNAWLMFHTPVELLHNLFEMFADNRLSSLFHRLSVHQGARLLCRIGEKTPTFVEVLLNRLPQKQASRLRYWMGVERREYHHTVRKSSHVEEYKKDLKRWEVCMKGAGEREPRRCEHIVRGPLASKKKDAVFCILRDLPDDDLAMVFKGHSSRNCQVLIERFSRNWQLKLLCRFEHTGQLELLLGKLPPPFSAKMRKLKNTKRCPELKRGV